jgi:hypothetical protein
MLMPTPRIVGTNKKIMDVKYMNNVLPIIIGQDLLSIMSLLQLMQKLDPDILRVIKQKAANSIFSF